MVICCVVHYNWLVNMLYPCKMFLYDFSSRIKLWQAGIPEGGLCNVTQNRKYRARHNVTIISKYFRKYHSPELKKKIDFLAVYCLLEM